MRSLAYIYLSLRSSVFFSCNLILPLLDKNSTIPLLPSYPSTTTDEMNSFGMLLTVLLSLIAFATAILPPWNSSATAFTTGHHSTVVAPGSDQHSHSTMEHSSGIPDWATWSVPEHNVTEATTGMPATTGRPNPTQPHHSGNASAHSYDTSLHPSASTYPHSTKSAFSPPAFSATNMTTATTFKTRTSSAAPVESVLSEITSYLSAATSELYNRTSKAAATSSAMPSVANVGVDTSSTNDEANCECSIPPGSQAPCSSDCDCCPDKNNNGQKVSNIYTTFLFWG